LTGDEFRDIYYSEENKNASDDQKEEVPSLAENLSADGAEGLEEDDSMEKKMHDLEVGEQQAKTFRVGDADTAAAMGSGGLKVLATPRLIAWMEHVAFKMIQMHCRSKSIHGGF